MEVIKGWVETRLLSACSAPYEVKKQTLSLGNGLLVQRVQPWCGPSEKAVPEKALRCVLWDSDLWPQASLFIRPPLRPPPHSCPGPPPYPKVSWGIHLVVQGRSVLRHPYRNHTGLNRADGTTWRRTWYKSPWKAHHPGARKEAGLFLWPGPAW